MNKFLLDAFFDLIEWNSLVIVFFVCFVYSMQLSCKRFCKEVDHFSSNCAYVVQVEINGGRSSFHAVRDDNV